jgi:CheY-like chemotaxis protein
VEEYLQQKKLFDIILMDLNMSETNGIRGVPDDHQGFEASKRIRELEKKYGITKEED